MTPRPAAPRWVKVLGTVTAILLIAFLVLHLSGNGLGGHGGAPGNKP